MSPPNSGDSARLLRNVEVGGPDNADSNNEDDEKYGKGHRMNFRRTRNAISYFQCMNSTRLMVLMILCLQNSMFTVLRRYSQGVLREVYSKVREPPIEVFESILLIGALHCICYLTLLELCDENFSMRCC